MSPFGWPDKQFYLKNAYKVRLTRAWQGIVVFVPPGDSNHPTQSPEFYDSTFHYLTKIGIPVVPCRCSSVMSSKEAQTHRRKWIRDLRVIFAKMHYTSKVYKFLYVNYGI